MANMSITVCDSCQALGKETQTWALHGPDGTRKLDLCDKHNQELTAYLNKLAPGAVARPKRRESRRQVAPREDRFDSRVKTPEEVEAMKTKTK